MPLNQYTPFSGKLFKILHSHSREFWSNGAYFPLRSEEETLNVVCNLILPQLILNQTKISLSLFLFGQTNHPGVQMLNHKNNFPSNDHHRFLSEMLCAWNSMQKF